MLLPPGSTIPNLVIDVFGFPISLFQYQFSPFLCFFQLSVSINLFIYNMAKENGNMQDLSLEESTMGNRTADASQEGSKRQIVYDLEDVPPWYAIIVFGFQVRRAFDQAG